MKRNRIFTEQESELIRASVAICEKSPSGLAWLIKGRKMNPGDPALCSVTSSGYQAGTINNMRLTAHRVVYFLHHGTWNKGTIDHIDGNKLNNNPENLRDVDQFLNSANVKVKRGAFLGSREPGKHF